MKDTDIIFSIPSPAKKDDIIELFVKNFSEETFLFKFIIGFDGVWDTIQNFSEKRDITWSPKAEGKYIIMVQAKKPESTKPFDYMVKMDYIIGNVDERIISEVAIEKRELKVGDKLKLVVNVNKLPVMYKYWIKNEDKWELVKDYSAENILNLTVKNPGKNEILVECRTLDSKNEFDDYQKVQFEVLAVEEVEIKDFRCLTDEMLADNELVFQVDAEYEDSRMVLYKFIKISSSGKMVCVQDYSTKRIVSFIEKEAGDYKLLCLAKDMYSPKHYDDRAIIDYTVKLYNPIIIQSFTSDLMSPQICDTAIELKAVVRGGRNLQYRYIIDGNSPVDSGYIKSGDFTWKPQHAGSYDVKLWVKDESFPDKYEAESSFDYTIDEYSSGNQVKITEVVLSKDKNVVKGEKINIKAVAIGGIDLKYSFIVRKDGRELEKVQYGSCDWVNFTPEEEGDYELEVMVKDKYSKKEYDGHEIVHLDVRSYVPAEIDYVLMPSEDIYLVGDNIKLEVITRRTQDTLIKYILKINGHLVEETGYVASKKYFLSPKCSGEYSLEILAKDKKSSSIYDSKRIINVTVDDAVQISNTKILWDKINIVVNESVMFSVKCDGGKDVCYEFYLMEQGEWNLVQNYGKMNYYTFMPYKKGNYKILALAKSVYKNCAYEDYDMMEFNVN